jgi:transketolase
MMDMRDAYGEALLEIGKEDERVVVLDADVFEHVRVHLFANDFPERFFEMGVAEANMIGVAAGLATVGLIPFANTFGVFASKRACDQVSVSVAYPNLNVKVVGHYSGLTTGNTGATHQSIDDVAIMRAMPNMMVVEPADTVELPALLRAVLQHRGPVYFRVMRAEVPTIFSKKHSFSLTKGVILREGEDVTLIGSGLMTAICLEAAEILARDGLSCQVINIHTIKPIDREMITRAAEKTGAIITAENHSIIGGLGSAVAEVLVETCPVPMERIGIKDIFGRSGRLEDLLKKYGLTANDIVESVKKAIGRKKEMRAKSRILSL